MIKTPASGVSVISGRLSAMMAETLSSGLTPRLLIPSQRRGFPKTCSFCNQLLADQTELAQPSKKVVVAGGIRIRLPSGTLLD